MRFTRILLLWLYIRATSCGLLVSRSHVHVELQLELRTTELTNLTN